MADVSNIMSKFFYITVPFSPVESKGGGIFTKIFSIFNPKQVVLKKNEVFETFKNQLWQRVDHIIAGLSGIGVQIVPLKTEEIIELLYNSYNPNIFSSTAIKDIDKIELDK